MIPLRYQERVWREYHERSSSGPTSTYRGQDHNEGSRRIAVRINAETGEISRTLKNTQETADSIDGRVE